MGKKRTDVNYMFQIKCFYQWLERGELSTSAVALWHGLMYMWNQSFWESVFTPAMASIIARTGLSKTTVLRARKELVDAGLLQVSERGKRALVRYKLITFGAKNDTLYKQNNTIQNETKQDIPPKAPRTRRAGRKKEDVFAEKDSFPFEMYLREIEKKRTKEAQNEGNN